MRMVPSEFRNFRVASRLFAVLTLLVLFGCSRRHQGEGFILRFIGTMQSLGLIRVFDFVGF